jgi:hypothetical protein
MCLTDGAMSKLLLTTAALLAFVAAAAGVLAEDGG